MTLRVFARRRGTAGRAGAACDRRGGVRSQGREAPDARVRVGVTGERMTISTSHGSVTDRRAIDGRAVDGYEPVHLPGQVARVRGETAMFRRRSVQPTRRALLHVQAAGEPAVAPDLVSWYTERAFHFYLACGYPARPGGRWVRVTRRGGWAPRSPISTLPARMSERPTASTR